MRVLVIGDIISQIGCAFVRERLPQYRRDNNIDIVVANGENSAVGNGILPSSAEFLLDSGVDVITTGNHVYKRREIMPYLDENPQVIRPANFPSICNGNGYYIYDGGKHQLCVINIMGTSYMENLDCPFETIDKILSEIDCKNIIVDIHAEATGEKKSFGFYVDGRVSAVVGTHTHVQTADEQILPNGTGYISDLGMTGPYVSVLGVVPERVIERLKYKMPTRFETAQGDCSMEGAIVEIDDKTGQCISINRVNVK